MMAVMSSFFIAGYGPHQSSHQGDHQETAGYGAGYEPFQISHQGDQYDIAGCGPIQSSRQIKVTYRTGLGSRVRICPEKPLRTPWVDPQGGLKLSQLICLGKLTQLQAPTVGTTGGTRGFLRAYSDSTPQALYVTLNHLGKSSNLVHFQCKVKKLNHLKISISVVFVLPCAKNKLILKLEPGNQGDIENWHDLTLGLPGGLPWGPRGFLSAYSDSTAQAGSIHHLDSPG